MSSGEIGLKAPDFSNQNSIRDGSDSSLFFLRYIGALIASSLLNAVNPYFENIQQKQGLFAYKVVMDESNNTAETIDRNQLVGAIYLQPTKTAEFIILDFNITPTGASFA